MTILGNLDANEYVDLNKNGIYAEEKLMPVFYEQKIIFDIDMMYWLNRNL